jgi:transcriptional regulator with XRE-family HTH domain
MTQQMTRQPLSQSWYAEAARAEDHFPSISVGGLACRLGLYPGDSMSQSGIVGELVKLIRRREGWTVSELASLAELSEESIQSIERYAPLNPDWLPKLAKAIGVPEDKLAQLSGISEISDPCLIDAIKILESGLRVPPALTEREESALNGFFTAIHR